ncbi:unnamed protein product [Fraxinus pennsylvanica]|uniref:Tesmin/TSO1-like CXC domain-containing protein n=1 Tax=Fraxinus pennsylvanica TaxID=56036 RepID=A0AAD1YY73_9LAMI|nr:unnamed protein product [Fraxinus pennsylvanica]
MYHGNFPVNLSKFFKKEPSDSGDGSIRCDCASICRNRYCRCFTASKFCTKYCTCHWCLNKPQRQDLQRINELPAYNRGRRGGVSQSDSCSGVEDEKEEEEEEEEDTYWKDWCRETGKYSPWNVPCVKQKQKETSPKESVGETPLRSRSKNSKSESKSISLEESPIRKKRENKSKSKNSTSDKKRKKE